MLFAEADSREVTSHSKVDSLIIPLRYARNNCLNSKSRLTRSPPFIERSFSSNSFEGYGPSQLESNHGKTLRIIVLLHEALQTALHGRAAYSCVRSTKPN